MNLDTPLKAGKLPPPMLEFLLKEFAPEDPSLIISPGIGEDIAAVRAAGEEVLVLKSDPITFATDRIGYYSVIVNANDIATSGAYPRWLLVTLLLPCGITLRKVWEIMEDLKRLCTGLGITLCGGHTELTDSVNRPVVSCSLIGTVPEKGLIRKERIKTGDAILLTKGIAVEGTSILCREFEGKLLSLGMSPLEIEQGKEYLNSISIIKEARIAADSGLVRGMHDVTEGGISSALLELSSITGKLIHLEAEKISLLPETEKACSLLGIDPLGLIGSGSLLLGVQAGGEEKLLGLLKQGGVEASVIGRAGKTGKGITATKKGKPYIWPEFSTDEITKLF